MPLPTRHKRASAITLATALLAPTSLALAPSAQAADQITNGTFDAGLTGWTIYPTSSLTDGAGCTTVPAGSAAYSAAIQQEVPLVKGESYRLTFRARSTPATQGPVRVVVQGGADVNYEQFLPATKPSFGAGFTTFEQYFTPDRDYPNAQLGFQQDIGTRRPPRSAWTTSPSRAVPKRLRTPPTPAPACA